MVEVSQRRILQIWLFVSWWSTTLWTARATRRRRPWGSMTLEWTLQFEFSSTSIWYALVMVVDIKVFFYISNICNNIEIMWVWGLFLNAQYQRWFSIRKQRGRIPSNCLIMYVHKEFFHPIDSTLKLNWKDFSVVTCMMEYQKLKMAWNLNLEYLKDK